MVAIRLIFGLGLLFVCVGVLDAVCPLRKVADASYVNYPGLDVSPGRDIAVRPASSFEVCGKGCMVCDGCAAFVLDQAQSRCYLKDNTDLEASDNQNLIAGILGPMVPIVGAAIPAPVLAVPVVTPPAPTPTAPAARKLENAETGKCLDSNTEGEVYAGECNGGSFQAWKREGKNFKNLATSLCLDGNREGKIYTSPCDYGNGFQHWVTNGHGNSLHSENTGLCLDSNGEGKIYGQGCNGGNYQNWWFG